MTSVLARPHEAAVTEIGTPRATPASPPERTILRRAPLFAGMEDVVILDLLPSFQVAQVPAEAVLFRAGESADRLYVVIQGKVKIGATVQGRHNLVAVLGPAEQFGELSLFDTGPRITTAQALTVATVAYVSKDELSRWVTTQPAGALRMLHIMARQLREANNVISDLISVDTAGRVAKQLLVLANRFGTSQLGHVRVAHELTQADLAELVGASRETVNKALANFSDRGWIQLDTKSVVIVAPEQLARRARTAI